MLNLDFLILCFYLIFILCRIIDYVFDYAFDWVASRRLRKLYGVNSSDNSELEDEWDWLSELEGQPIEVTFDHETFLVCDRQTGRWRLEQREHEPPDDFIDLLLGDDAILIEATSMYKGYINRKTKGFGIKSPSGRF